MYIFFSLCLFLWGNYCLTFFQATHAVDFTQQLPDWVERGKYALRTLSELLQEFSDIDDGIEITDQWDNFGCIESGYMSDDSAISDEVFLCKYIFHSAKETRKCFYSIKKPGKITRLGQKKLQQLFWLFCICFYRCIQQMFLAVTLWCAYNLLNIITM